MHGQRFRVVEALEEVVGGDVFAGLFFTQHPAERVGITLGQRVGKLLCPADVVALVNTEQLPVLQVAGNTVLFDAVANFLLGLLGERPVLLRSLDAEGLFHLEHVLALAAADQAAAATGRAETDALGLEQDDVHTLFGQVDRGGQARETTTDDADVGGEFRVELGPFDHAVRRRDIVAIRMARSVQARCHGDSL